MRNNTSKVLMKNLNPFLTILITVSLLGNFGRPACAALDQFDVTNNNVDLQDFMSGGPPKDGIPSIDNPQFVLADAAGFLRDDDKVVGVVIDGEARAYPIRILNWHEVVNDKIADEPIAVTWCPLTRSAVAFDRRVKDVILEFGVSGLLYNSNVVMYDRQTQGLWSQLRMGGLTGQYADNVLDHIPLKVIDWKSWRERYPQTLVLSDKTGHFRDYGQDPYERYHASRETMFPAGVSDNRLEPKSLVFGVQINDMVKAYALDKLTLLDQPFHDTVGDTQIQIRPLDGGAFEATDKNGNILPSVVAYWFAWSAFNSDTLIYK